MSETITGIIRRAEYTGHTTMGNPKYQVAIETDDGDIRLLRTSSNASISYDVQNLEHSGERREFHLTNAGFLAFSRIAPEPAIALPTQAERDAYVRSMKAADREASSRLVMVGVYEVVTELTADRHAITLRLRDTFAETERLITLTLEQWAYLSKITR